MDTLHISQLPTGILHHITPPLPISIPYTIRVDQEFHELPQQQRYTIYDILVPVPSPLTSLQRQILASPSHLSTLKQITAYDADIAAVVQSITLHKARHAFFVAMSKDPIGFVKRWTSSQQRDLEVLLGESGRWGEGTGEEWRRGGEESVWGSREAREAVALLLARNRGVA